MAFVKYNENDIKKRIVVDNPWWQSNEIAKFYQPFPYRAYFESFHELVRSEKPRRALVLMGPRRVGKTVMLNQSIKKLVDAGVPARKIVFLSLDKPIYSGLDPEYLIELSLKASGLTHPEGCYFFFDEIQYLKNWENYLKSMVDFYHETKFIVSGSAAAALKRKSNESGAGRFTDFVLPPLTFAEFIDMSGKEGMLKHRGQISEAIDIFAFNQEFIKYIHYGGYPEVVMNPEMKDDLERYVTQDIIDKVLLKDLPSLYGVNDTQEMNSFFNVLAYNTSNEASMANMERDLQISKHLLENYLEYLQAAFLIRKLSRVDINARRLKKEQQFKLFLTNVSFRSAMFTPIEATSEMFGGLVETAIFDQYLHRSYDIRYARWKEGRKTREVDFISISRATQKPEWALEIKWSNSGDTANLKSFLEIHKLTSGWITTINQHDLSQKIKKVPASIMCYMIGKTPEIILEG
ncbi:MAG: ATP-binding protein [Bacteroidota bacterium]